MSSAVRKTWLAVTIAGGLFFAFLALLLVGTFSAAASLTAANGTLALAKGAVPAAYSNLVQKWGNQCAAINPALLAAQLYQESGWNPKAQSGADAQGIAQFIPGTWATHGVDGNGDGVRDVWDPADAIARSEEHTSELQSHRH
jgi:soluble lytic murein transglycosylase-like protein